MRVEYGGGMGGAWEGGGVGGFVVDDDDRLSFFSFVRSEGGYLMFGGV